ncbi:MAG TPA: hypothetical protein VIT67_09515 [Povalibacter sp.]|jgi:hypothetical protein
MHPSIAVPGLVLAGILSVGQSAADEAPVDAAGKAKQVAPAVRKLDLRLPDITTIFPAEVIAQVLQATRDPDTIEEVEVERERNEKPPPRTPAWLFFLPLPHYTDTPPDATDSYRPVPLPPGF